MVFWQVRSLLSCINSRPSTIGATGIRVLGIHLVVSYVNLFPTL